MSEIDELVLRKIDKIIEDIHQIKVQIAELNYWRSAITELQNSEESQNDRISKQDVLIAQLSTKMMIIGAAIVVLIPIISSGMFWFLNHHSH
jgi:hypothetical protein